MSKSTGLIVMAVLALGVLASVPAEAATYYVAKTGNDSNPCTQAQPCLTVGKAKNLATSPGDIVQVGPGTYNETVTVTASGSSGKKIVFRGHNGSGCPTSSISDINSRGVRPNPTAVVTGGFDVEASYVSVECFKITSGDVSAIGNNLSNIDITDNYIDHSGNPGQSGMVYVVPATDSESNFPKTIYIARNYGYKAGNAAFIIKANGAVVESNESERPLHSSADGDHVQFWGNNITFRQNYFHGAVLTDCPTCHTDCFQTWNIGNASEVARNITIDANTCFHVDQVVLVRNVGGSLSAMSDFTVTNNLFAYPRLNGGFIGGSELERVGGTNVAYHNTFVNHSLGIDQSGTSATCKNNLAYQGSSGCMATGGGSVSGSNNVVASSNPGFVNASADDYHLSSNASSLINKGATGLSSLLSSILSLDREGNTRDSQPDIGAFEFGAAPATSQRPQPPTNLQVLVQ